VPRRPETGASSSTVIWGVKFRRPDAVPQGAQGPLATWRPLLMEEPQSARELSRCLDGAAIAPSALLKKKAPSAAVTLTRA
jgi:hypothetical protein